MKYLKKYDEGFVDWITNRFKREEPEDTDTDDNKIAKGIINTIIPAIDPENIEYAIEKVPGGYDNHVIEVSLSGSYLRVCRKNGRFVVKVDDDAIECDDYDYKDNNGDVTKTNYKRVIFESLLKKYNDEKSRVRFQRISTNIGL